MNQVGNVREFSATHWWRKAGNYSTTSNTRKSRAAITARAHGRPASIRLCDFCFRRSISRRGDRPELLEWLAVNLKDTGETADEFLVFLKIEGAFDGRPFQLAR